MYYDILDKRWSGTQKVSIICETLKKTSLLCLKTESHDVTQLFTYGPDINEELFPAFSKGKVNYE